jgi:hypothetical protein
MSVEDLLTVCPPSTRLAAPIYKDISLFRFCTQSAHVMLLFVAI